MNPVEGPKEKTKSIKLEKNEGMFKSEMNMIKDDEPMFLNVPGPNKDDHSSSGSSASSHDTS